MARTKKVETEEEKEQKEVIKVNTDKIKKEVLDFLNNDYKEEINDHITTQIRKEFYDMLEKQHKRELRNKNKTILFKNIIILILVVLLGAMIYFSYTKGVFDEYLNTNHNKETTEKKETNKEEVKPEEPPVPTLDELKEKYGNLIDKFYLNGDSIYLESFYNKNLSDEIKLVYTLDNIDFKDFETEDDYYIIDEELVKDKFKELFNNSLYKPTSFDYNGHKIKYLSKLKSYVSDSIFEKNNSNIVREVIDIKVDNNTISITTIEGLVVDNELYNPKTKEEIDDEFSGNLLDYQNSIETITYVFDNNKLSKIS